MRPRFSPKRKTYGRIDGRRGVKLRAARLAREPLCRMCKEQGRYVEAVTVDHIRPLSLGGLDTDDNCQSLCADCHDSKTASEANHYAAVNHPDWLEPSAIPLTIVCGPPASGKTTYVRDNARHGDTIISLDDILTELRPTYSHWSAGWDKELFNRGIRERNHKLGQLKSAEYGRAWFIISAPTETERKWWQGKLGGEVIVLHPGTEECKRRALERGTPNAIAGIDKWERASMQPWAAPQAKREKQTIGLDGWPIN